jgi:two-component system sensor kinase FixL
MTQPRQKGRRLTKAGHPVEPAFLLMLRNAVSPWEDVVFLQVPPSVFGFSRDEWIAAARDFANLVPTHDQIHFGAVQSQLEEDCAAGWSFRVRRADGRLQWVHEELRWIEEGDGRPRRMACLLVAGVSRVTAALKVRARERLDGFVQGWQEASLGSRLPGDDFGATAEWSADAPARPSEERLAYAVHGAGDGLWDWDFITNQVYYSPRWKQMLGYAEDELEDHLRSWERLVHPADRDRAMQQASEYRAGLRSNYEMEFRMRHKRGHWVEILARGTIIRDAKGRPQRMVGTHMDITARKQSEAALRESEARFRQLAEVTPEGIAIIEDTTLVDANPQLAALLGYELPDMIGRSVCDFIAPSARAQIAAQIREAGEGTYECPLLRQDGATLVVECSGRVLTWQGRPRRVMVLRDLTATRQAQAELEALRAALERSRRLAEFSEISAAIVHQLGQPFSAITGNICVTRELLANSETRQTAAIALLQEIETDLQRVREIMARLRALVNPEPSRREPTDLNGLLADVLRVLGREAEVRQISVRLDGVDELPPVSVDRVQISQVIFNLIRNAFDSVAACPVERRLVDIVTRAANGQWVEMAVSDLGVGIAPGCENRIFEAFFTTKRDGMGVGLRISRTIVKAHGGRLEGVNNPDRPGATFRIHLPTVPAVVHDHESPYCHCAG